MNSDFQNIEGIYVFCYYFKPKKKILFQLIHKIEYSLSNGLLEVVPPKYITDFATVPQWARFAVNVVDKHYKATILHDWLYDNQKFSRKQADLEFLYQMKKDGIPYVLRNVMYFAVRIGGKKRWKQKSKPKLN